MIEFTYTICSSKKAYLGLCFKCLAIKQCALSRHASFTCFVRRVKSRYGTRKWINKREPNGWTLLDVREKQLIWSSINKVKIEQQNLLYSNQEKLQDINSSLGSFINVIQNFKDFYRKKNWTMLRTCRREPNFMLLNTIGFPPENILSFCLEVSLLLTYRWQVDSVQSSVGTARFDSGSMALLSAPSSGKDWERRYLKMDPQHLWTIQNSRGSKSWVQIKLPTMTSKMITRAAQIINPWKLFENKIYYKI